MLFSLHLTVERKHIVDKTSLKIINTLIFFFPGEQGRLRLIVSRKLLFLTMNEERCNKKILILKIIPKFNFSRTFLTNFHRFRSVDLLHAD